MIVVLYAVFAILVLLWLKREHVRVRRIPLKPVPQDVPSKPAPPKVIIDMPEYRCAVHEAGYAVAAWSCTCVTKMNIATIETEDGGLVEYMIHSTDKSDGMWCWLVIILSGIAAENFVHGKARSTSSDRDFERALGVAQQLAAQGASPPWTPLTGSVIPFAQIYKSSIDPKEIKVLEHGYRMARHVVRSHGHRFHRVAALLLTHKTVREVDVEKVLGRRHFTKLMGLMRPSFIVPKTREAA